jgi:hypothetical protein
MSLTLLLAFACSAAAASGSQRHLRRLWQPPAAAAAAAAAAPARREQLSGGTLPARLAAYPPCSTPAQNPSLAPACSRVHGVCCDACSGHVVGRSLPLLASCTHLNAVSYEYTHQSAPVSRLALLRAGCICPWEAGRRRVDLRLGRLQRLGAAGSRLGTRRLRYAF